MATSDTSTDLKNLIVTEKEEVLTSPSMQSTELSDGP